MPAKRLSVNNMSRGTEAFSMPKPVLLTERFRKDIDESLEPHRKDNYISHEEAKKQILSKSPK
jgi:hypothetical protein